MIFEGDDKVRLTKSEMKLLRQRNAANGEIITEIRTREQLLEAIIGGLSIERAREMLAFIEGLPDDGSGGPHT
jgi:hypothetical protein